MRIVDGRIASLRFYLEPVDDAAVGADDAVRRAVGGVGGPGGPGMPIASTPETAVATTVGAAR
jgi:hypothetical protein